MITPGNLGGKRALVTGGAGGLGLHTALGLARQGARILVVDRDVAAGERAVRTIADTVAGAHAEFVALDLADLTAIRACAQRLVEGGEPLDLLVNNAGLLPPMRRAETAQGFELGFGVSVIGHFALTGLLLPALLRSQSPRVVTVSSIAHARARIPFEDLRMLLGYDPTRAYASAKLGALLMALELDRRARAADCSLCSVAAHPGIARTQLGANWERDGARRWRDRLATLAMRGSMRWLSQSVEGGAAATLCAATSESVRGGDFIGPDGFMQMRGAPCVVKPHRVGRNPDTAARLWRRLQAETGVVYSLS